MENLIKMKILSIINNCLDFSAPLGSNGCTTKSKINIKLNGLTTFRHLIGLDTYILMLKLPSVKVEST